MYALSTKCAAGRTLSGVSSPGGVNILGALAEPGGQHDVGTAPLGRSAGPHLSTSGVSTGFALETFFVFTAAAAPYIPPRPIRTSRRFSDESESFWLFGFIALHEMAGLRLWVQIERGDRACAGRKGHEGEAGEVLLAGQGGLVIN